LCVTFSHLPRQPTFFLWQLPFFFIVIITGCYVHCVMRRPTSGHLVSVCPMQSRPISGDENEQRPEPGTGARPPLSLWKRNCYCFHPESLLFSPSAFSSKCCPYGQNPILASGLGIRGNAGRVELHHFALDIVPCPCQRLSIRYLHPASTVFYDLVCRGTPHGPLSAQKREQD
jgi:hypothetical protein